MSDCAWSYSPSFHMRRQCILDTIQRWQPGRFLECGSGTGSITKLFLDMGYCGTGYDISPRNLNVLEKNLSLYGHAFQITRSLVEMKTLSYDYLFAFEVLEHIENDWEALRDWSRYLKVGGRLLISVPARMAKFREDDRYAGHLRRYEKAALRQLLTHCGYTDILIQCYGVPLTNLTRLGSVFFHRREIKKVGERFPLSARERSMRSGVERIKIINAFSFMFNPATLWPFKFLQRFFYSFDFGEGYVVTATKSQDGDLVEPS